MAVRHEIVESRREVHAAPDKARQVCERRRVGEPAVSSKHSRKRTEAYLKQYVEGLTGEHGRR